MQEQPDNLVDFFLNSPLRDSEIDLERCKDTGRDIGFAEYNDTDESN